MAIAILQSINYNERVFASIVKWISRRSSEPLLGVRIPLDAPATKQVNCFTCERDSKDFSLFTLE